MATFEEAWQSYVDDVETAVEETVAEMLADWEAGKLPYPPIEAYAKAAGPSWQELVAGDDFTPVMGLVHDRMRMNEVDIHLLSEELFKARKTEFDDAVSDYMAQMGAGGKADLRTKSILNEMRVQSGLDASSIATTYNRDLARSIVDIKNSTPTANRNVYVSRLRAWEAERRTWKITQISLNTVMTTRDRALKIFSDKNDLSPYVEMFPKVAKEPICEGWVNRGVLPYEIAKRNPSPFHVGCLHFWRPQFVQGENINLWTGGSSQSARMSKHLGSRHDQRAHGRGTGKHRGPTELSRHLNRALHGEIDEEDEVRAEVASVINKTLIEGGLDHLTSEGQARLDRSLEIVERRNYKPEDKERLRERYNERALRDDSVGNNVLQSWFEDDFDNLYPVEMQLIAQDRYGGRDHAVLSKARDNRVLSDEQANIAFDTIQNHSQQWLKKQGIGPDDQLLVYRGLRLSKGQTETLSGNDFEHNPLASWTLDRNVAKRFAGLQKGGEPHDQVILSTRIKASDIFSTGRSGLGDMTESEIVVLGGRTPTISFEVIG